MRFYIHLYMCGISGFYMSDVKLCSALREQSQGLVWGVKPGGLHSPGHRPVGLLETHILPSLLCV